MVEVLLKRNGWARKFFSLVQMRHLIDVDACDDNGCTALHCAAMSRASVDVVETLIRAGAQLGTRDNRGQTPLHKAAERAGTVVIDTLIKQGADLEARDKEGQTPLHRAAMSSGSVAVNALIAAGADFHACDQEGTTPLHLAAKHDKRRILEVLLAAGAKANSRTKQGCLAVDLVPDSSNLKSSEIYWKLDEARFEQIPSRESNKT